MNKICTKCSLSLSIECFSWKNKAKNKLKNQCKKCDALQNSARYASQKDKILKQNENWKVKNKQSYLNYQKNYNKTKRKK